MKKNIILYLIIYLFILSIPLIIFNKSNIHFIHASNQNIKQKHNNYNIKKDTNHIIPSKSSQPSKEQLQLETLSSIISSISSQNTNLPSTKKDICGNNIIHSDGYFNILNLQTGKIDRISEKDYVIGAVCSEMPITFHEEALKAQAVSAHTYALKMRLDKKNNPNPNLKGADFDADPAHWQKYVTKKEAMDRFGDRFDEYWGKINSAVNDVADIIMIYNEEPIIAAYHAICSGKTESATNVWGGEAPYLIPTESYGDNLAPDYETTITISSKDAKKKLLEQYPDIDLQSNPQKWFQNINRSNSGSVLNIKVGNTDISGNYIRNAFGLRSLNFDVKYDNVNNNFVFLVTGYGHGIGLSQYGADYMAKNGSSFDEILKHYYSNISFAHTSNIE